MLIDGVTVGLIFVAVVGAKEGFPEGYDDVDTEGMSDGNFVGNVIGL